jgi:hypothetical protein
MDPTLKVLLGFEGSYTCLLSKDHIMGLTSDCMVLELANSYIAKL